MAKRVEYTTDGFWCKDKCPHSENYIGSIPCIYCSINEYKGSHERRREEILKDKGIVWCNHPNWNN